MTDGRLKGGALAPKGDLMSVLNKEQRWAAVCLAFGTNEVKIDA